MVYQIQEAIRGILRNHKRYAILTILLTVVVAGITVTSAAWFSAERVSKEYSERLGIKVTLTPDLRKIFALGTDENGYLQVPEITTLQLMGFSQSAYLKQTLFTASLQVYGDKIQGLDQERQTNDLPGEDLDFTPAGSAGETIKRQTPNCLLTACSDLALMDEFSLGIRELSQGEFFHDKDTCIISQEFAERNGLHVGDTFCVNNVDDETQEFILTVSGIYLDGTTPQAPGSVWAVNNRRNEILVSYETLNRDDLAGLNLQAVYYLAELECADRFERELREQGLPEEYNVNVDADSYRRATEPLEGLKRIVGIMFCIVMLTGISVMVLFSVLQIYDRKYELGILRAIGMKKSTLVSRMLTECCIVCLIGICLGIGIGCLAAPGISRAILEQQTDRADKEFGESYADYGEGVIELNRGQNESIPLADKIDIRLSPDMICLIIASALFLEIMANGAGIIYCIREEPMKMLIER